MPAPCEPLSRVLLICHDVIGRTMAGPGIRYYHLARTLAKHSELTLALPVQPGQEQPAVVFPTPDGALGLQTIPYVHGLWHTLEEVAARSDVIVFPSDIAFFFPQLADLEKPALVVDGYDPLLVEWLTLYGAEEIETQVSLWQRRMRDLGHQYLFGDFFICASERQRDWWLGLLEANGRINPWTLGEDPSLRRLVDVVPYGLPETVPQHTRPVLKGVWPGIGPEDRVLLWGGGLWPWLDPLTAIRAMARIWPIRQDVRLVFPGTRHPNPTLSEIHSHNQRARALAAELGLLDTGVFFGDWVAYEDWPNVLLESDIALSLHYDTLETRLAFRSRVLEYIWAGLPMVVTGGDATSQLVEQYGLGVLVGCEDAEGVADAVLRLLQTPPAAGHSSLQTAQQALRWEAVARPLVAFCRRPRRAPDRTALGKRLGNPFYVEPHNQQMEEVTGLQEKVVQLTQENAQLHAEKARWQERVQGYEQGRFIRFMRWIHQQKQRSAR